MSGHSRWSTIKRKKGAADAIKGKIFTKVAREIMVAARTGGGDPNGNPRLRMALQAARAANMPRENQERAVKKGTGELEGMTFEELVYEGRGPAGAAFVVEILTDNKNRTLPELRYLFSRAGGELLVNGAVAWMFSLKGVVTIAKERIGEDELISMVMEAGGEDVQDGGEVWVVTCEQSALSGLQTALESLEPLSAGMQYLTKPESAAELSGEQAVAVAQFWAKLDEHDDVQNVFTNVSLPDEVMEEHGP